MSMDKSLKSKNTLERHRNVLSRAERIESMTDLGVWEEGASPYGLPKLAHLPKMLVWGERDFCFSPEFRRTFEYIWPDIESHPVQDASHYVLEDASGLCIRLVQDFLGRYP